MFESAQPESAQPESVQFESVQPASGIPAASDPRLQPPVPTGDAAVDSLLDELSALDDAPVSTHGQMYSDLHDGLLAALNDEGDTPPESPVPGPAKDAR